MVKWRDLDNILCNGDRLVSHYDYVPYVSTLEAS